MSGGDDKTVRIWDVKKTDKELYTFREHSDSVFSVDVFSNEQSVSSNEQHIISGSWDRTLKLWLWNGKYGRYIYSFKGHSDRIYSVNFSHDGNCIISGGNDGIFLWDVKRRRWIARLLVFNDDEWITVTSNGYFTTSSRKIGQRLSIQVNGKQLINNRSFYRPDLVRYKLK